MGVLTIYEPYSSVFILGPLIFDKNPFWDMWDSYPTPQGHRLRRALGEPVLCCRGLAMIPKSGGPYF